MSDQGRDFFSLVGSKSANCPDSFPLSTYCSKKIRIKINQSSKVSSSYVLQDQLSKLWYASPPQARRLISARVLSPNKNLFVKRRRHLRTKKKKDPPLSSAREPTQRAGRNPVTKPLLTEEGREESLCVASPLNSSFDSDGLNHQDVSTICRPKPEARIRGEIITPRSGQKKFWGGGTRLPDVRAVRYEAIMQKGTVRDYPKLGPSRCTNPLQ